MVGLGAICILGMEKKDGHNIVLVGMLEMYLWSGLEFGDKWKR